MGVCVEVVPFLLASLVAGIVVLGACRLFRVGWRRSAWSGLIVAGVLAGYMLYFFRDPVRTPPADPKAVVSGADGVVARIKYMHEDKYLKCDTVRISIFLSLFDVHVNRAPIDGMATFLGYAPGKRLFTFTEKSSDVNQRNAILIEGSGTKCLLYQIVGPVARRVVYWPDHDKPAPLQKGQRIGMMKFGSRMDLYFPVGDVEVKVREGDRVAAGETVIAVLAGDRL